MTTLRINRAPVHALRAAVVAERLGSPWETALTVGQAVAGMTAHAKGVGLGICAQPEERPHEPEEDPHFAALFVGVGATVGMLALPIGASDHAWIEGTDRSG